MAKTQFIRNYIILMNFSVRLIQIYILCQVSFPLNNAASKLVGWQAIFRFKAPELL